MTTLYIEAVGGSDQIGDVRIKAQLIPGPDAPEYEPLSDTVPATVFYVESVRPIEADFHQDHRGKIMISTKHCTTNTPLRVYTTNITTKADTPAQHHATNGTHDRFVRATAYIAPMPPNGLQYLGFPELTVYFEVTDPDDLSPYDAGVTGSDRENRKQTLP